MESTAQELIVLAAARLASAESELTAALGDTPRSERANKLMVSDRLRLALAEIAEAKRALAEVLGVHSRIGAPHETSTNDDAE